MKICFLTINIFCMGGVQRVVSNVANALSIENEVTVICIGEIDKIDRTIYNLKDSIEIISQPIFNEGKLYKVIRKLILKIHQNTKLLDNKLFQNFLEDIYIPNITKDSLAKVLSEGDYDVVIGVEGFCSYLLGSIAELIDVKTIGWQHNSFDAYFNTPGKYYWKRDFIFKKYLPKLANVIVLTHEDKLKFNSHFNITTIKIFNPLSFDLSVGNGLLSKNILFVGRLEEKQKGLDLLIKSFYLVNQNRPDWNLIIVGDGPDRKKLSDDITKYNLWSNVSIHPFTNRIQDFYVDASIFISTSRWEGFGLVITEAMTCGLPVVAFENSGPTEILDNGEYGILVPKYDVNKFAQAIIRLIENPNELRYYSQKSLERSKDFSLSEIIKQWEYIIEN